MLFAVVTLLASQINPFLSILTLSKNLRGNTASEQLVWYNILKANSMFLCEYISFHYYSNHITLIKELASSPPPFFFLHFPLIESSHMEHKSHQLRLNLRKEQKIIQILTNSPIISPSRFR